ncbi:MAG TPA: hypothetical protein VK302_11020 [Terriglobales bacterium]|nr:hypothetical protein [Terriglobales bacterium]
MHTALLVVAGLLMVGIWSAVFEQLAMRQHPYAARILAVVIVIATAYTHSWMRLGVATALAVLFLAVRRGWRRRSQ